MCNPGRVGIEPTLADPESAVLPLDDLPSLIYFLILNLPVGGILFTPLNPERSRRRIAEPLDDPAMKN